jgi:hypothetical protein
MVYDMYWRSVDPAEQDAIAAAVAAAVFEAAVKQRDALPRHEEGLLIEAGLRAYGYSDHRAWKGRTDRYAQAQARVDAASKAVDRARASYFRLNISGMGWALDAMSEFGMVYADSSHPPFPTLEQYGLDTSDVWDQVEALKDPDYFAERAPEVLAAARANAEKIQEFTAAEQEVLAWRGNADSPGIPLHKFSSSDGWIVLPAECETAVRVYEARVAELGAERVLQIVDGNADLWKRWIKFVRGAASHDGFEVR